MCADLTTHRLGVCVCVSVCVCLCLLGLSPARPQLQKTDERGVLSREHMSVRVIDLAISNGDNGARSREKGSGPPSKLMVSVMLLTRPDVPDKSKLFIYSSCKHEASWPPDYLLDVRSNNGAWIDCVHNLLH